MFWYVIQKSTKLSKTVVWNKAKRYKTTTTLFSSTAPSVIWNNTPYHAGDFIIPNNTPYYRGAGDLSSLLAIERCGFFTPKYSRILKSVTYMRKVSCSISLCRLPIEMYIFCLWFLCRQRCILVNFNSL